MLHGHIRLTHLHIAPAQFRRVLRTLQLIDQRIRPGGLTSPGAFLLRRFLAGRSRANHLAGRMTSPNCFGNIVAALRHITSATPQTDITL